VVVGIHVKQCACPGAPFRQSHRPLKQAKAHHRVGKAKGRPPQRCPSRWIARTAPDGSRSVRSLRTNENPQRRTRVHDPTGSHVYCMNTSNSLQPTSAFRRSRPNSALFDVRMRRNLKALPA
jgi:hypothetical protein